MRFGSNGPMSNITMWKARYVAEGFPEEVVQAKGTKLEPGAHYYEPLKHKGHLRCAFCEASVHHNAGALSTSGSTLAGVPPHIKTNPEQKHHEDCAWQFRDASQSPTEIDISKGYLIHINTAHQLSKEFREKIGIKDRLSDSEKEQMKGMERIVIHDAAGFVKFLESADLVRLDKTLMKFQGAYRPLKKALMRLGAISRWIDFVEEQKKAPVKKFRLRPFGAFEVKLEKYYTPKFEYKTIKGKRKLVVEPVPLDPIRIGWDCNGRAEMVQIYIHPELERDNSTRTAFSKPGTYLVFGKVRYETKQSRMGTTHYFHMELTTGGQVTLFDAKAIYSKMQIAAARRAGGPEQPSA